MYKESGQIDAKRMRTALALGRRGCGRTGPNPPVGCVIVKNGVVAGRGRTGDGGRPHAEAQALAQAGAAARGADVYVTLEPCAHEREEGNCAEALIAAGVARVILPCADPDPRTAGRGIAKLRAAGIAVTEGVAEVEAREVNRGFFLRVTERRPMVTLKIATDAAGKIAGPDGARVQITGEMAQRHAHLERTRHDAILAGIGTVLKDDPVLTARLEGVTHNLTRIVLDSKLKIPMDSALVRSAHDTPLWIFHDSGEDAKKALLEKEGIGTVKFGTMEDILHEMIPLRLSRLLVEGGARVWQSFIDSGFYDRVLWYRSPVRIGEGVDAFAGREVEAVLAGLPLKHTETRPLGGDMLSVYERQA